MLKPVALATRHGKEQALEQPLRELGYKIVVPEDFQSDSFGTFTREVKRPDTQIGTARLKALAAAEQTGLSRAVASEGSFGPHPVVPFIALARELVLFVDLESAFEVQGWRLGGKTNFRSTCVHSLDEAERFCRDVGFPTHAVVLSKDQHQMESLEKGIVEWTRLSQLLKTNSNRGFLETDMRAMMNPTRMERIAEAGADLFQAFQNRCPSCSAPGWRVIDTEKGLPCGWCAARTDLVKTEIFGCSRCEQTARVEKKDKADSTYCQLCNP